MTNELTIIDQAAVAELAQELGAKSLQRNTLARVPMLKINRDVEDSNGRELPRGKIFLSGDNPAYADTVTFRPLSHHFQYSRYDAVQGKFACISRQISNWGEEARDTCGTIRCGKPEGKTRSQMSPEEQAKYKDVKLARLVRGLVSYTGTTLDGDEVTVEMQPCLLKLTGQNNYQSGKDRPYAPFEEQFHRLIPNGYDLWNYDVTLSTKKHRNPAGVMWYTFEYSFDPNKPIALTSDVFESVKAVAELVRAENKKVDDEYMRQIRKSVDDAYDTFEYSDDLDDDMSDVA